MNVLVVDDMAMYRALLSAAISEHQDVDNVKTTSSGRLSLLNLKQNSYDLVFLDVEMPDMDGLQTLREIKTHHPDVSVVMVSAVNSRGASKVMEALDEGALEFISKPKNKNIEENKLELRRHIDSVIKVMKTPGRKIKPTKKLKVTIPQQGNLPQVIDIVAVGVSTGGPTNLKRFLKLLPSDFKLPIVIVQHMPPVFTAEFAQHLNAVVDIKVKEAQDGEQAQKGVAYIAPGGLHLTVQGSANHYVLKTNTNPPENSCRPSVDVLFRSIATQTRSRGVLSVVLTGMGADGKRGVEELKAALPMWSMTESEESCVVYGMPRSVEEAGLSDQVMSVDDLSRRVVELVELRGGR